MTEIESLNLLKKLLKQNPELVQLWLTPILNKQQKVPDQFNWLLFASQAGQLAYRFCESRWLSLEWTQIAIASYRFLAANNPQLLDCCMDSIMNLRINAIIKFGVVENHQILDTKPILNWVFKDLKLSPEEALRESSNWLEELKQSNTIETPTFFDQKIAKIRELRQIKTKLAKLKRLVEHRRITPDREIESWLKVQAYLP